MFKIETTKSEDKYSSFIIEPLERGFGITLGNALRRVLLSSIPGMAVTGVRIRGLLQEELSPILHEFSPIPCVKEDVQEFLLNIKQINLRSVNKKTATLYLEAEGERKIYAKDLTVPAEIEITNPDLYLATLDSSKAQLSVELNAEYGKGYVPAKHLDNQPLGVIPIDAIFSPVRKVNFSISSIRAGLENTMDKVTLEVWTNGAVSPTEAVIKAASILIEHLTPFQTLGQTLQKKVELVRLSVPAEQYNLTVEKMGLSVRVLNSLKRANINTLGELLERLSEGKVVLRGFGRKSEELVYEKLDEMGLLSLVNRVREQMGVEKLEKPSQEIKGESAEEDSSANKEKETN